MQNIYLISLLVICIFNTLQFLEAELLTFARMSIYAVVTIFCAKCYDQM